jgi:5-methylcytosine-specific restriction endonuclease McrA
MQPTAETAVPPSISTLSDDDLISRVEDLVQRERLTTLEILFHLAEVDRRRLWRDLEYRSMFDYCIRRLRYSEGATARRLRVARLIARHPYVHDRIRDGRLSLCAVSKIASAVLDDGRVDLIAAVEGKRLDQVDAIIATHRNPARPVRESIRLLCVERRVDEKAAQAALAPNPKPAAADPTAPVTAPAPEPTRREPAVRPTVIERVFRIQFGIDANTMAKFSRVQSIAATRRRRHVDLSELFGILCDVYLERYDPARRAHKKTKKGRTERSSATPARPTQARRIPQPVRDEVFRRDGGRCTFVDKSGARCEATINLEVDHVRPFALGGSHEASNLRLMCPAHNRLLAERTYGKRTITRLASSDDGK